VAGNLIFFQFDMGLPGQRLCRSTHTFVMSFLRQLRIVRLLFFLGVAGAGFFSHSSGSITREFKEWMSPSAPASPQPVLPAPSLPSPASVDSTTGAGAPAPDPIDSTVPTPLPAWQTPKVIPLMPGGTLTTPTAIYNNVRIVKVEADRVTIMHENGRTVVPMWQLPSTLQEQLNYDPKAAEAAAAQRGPGEAQVEPTVATIIPPTGPTPTYLTETTDYTLALSVAKSSGKLVLLHFTGSDWCPYCQMLDSEVLSKSDFSQFASNNYITVTVDFPHNTTLPDSLKQQNDSLAQKYHVDGYPTLLVIDGNEKERGRISGYSPGSGPGPVISQLQNFNHAN
jgi:thiol-disulfide isomerase/thioredoxin